MSVLNNIASIARYVFILIILGYCNSTIAQNDHTLLLEGKINLREEIKSEPIKSSLVYNDSVVVQINTSSHEFDFANLYQVVSVNDSLFTSIPFGIKCTICYSHKNYQTKCLVVNTINILKSSNGYLTGFDFPYEIDLYKSNSTDSIIVGEIYYNPVSDYFDFK